MFTYAVRNIVHKQASEEINILYYPNNDIIDDIVTDWDANFFILADIKQNKLNKNNVCYTTNIVLNEYDFILCYGLDNQIIGMSNKLHIPIIVYIKYGEYSTTKILNHQNIYYIIEHNKILEADNMFTIMPTVKQIENKDHDNNVCIFIRNDRNYGNLIEILSSKIKNLSIVDDNKINQNSMIEILSKHSVFLDLCPETIYKMLYCANNARPYITIQNEITNQYKEIYDGLFFLPQQLDSLLDLLTQLLHNNISYKNNLVEQEQVDNTLKFFLNKIKNKGMIL